MQTQQDLIPQALIPTKDIPQQYELKIFEIRDREKTIPMVGVKFRPSYDENNIESYLIRFAGYGHSNNCILFGQLVGGEFRFAENSWRQNDRTFPVAHSYITKHWDELESGALIDIEFILGESLIEKQSNFVKFNGVIV